MRGLENRLNSTTSEMRKNSRENTLVRKFSLVVISAVEKKFAKTQAFDWLRYFVIQNTSIWLASLFPFRNGVETNSTTRRREIFRRETLQNHVAHAFNLFTRNFSHLARRGIRPLLGIKLFKRFWYRSTVNLTVNFAGQFNVVRKTVKTLCSVVCWTIFNRTDGASF